ncbi:MAG: PQQ-binding-like beta-propeller repeat protein [Candidatus Bathyarchaeota archaeon]|nr:PQQ-binding-like beta-propeller repeat protein [Candidatus Bathyarchaeota archaeon]MDH5595135.1 PQQ-binding-like beta-propeller repeat protein [Candidatus Bathyarchaeota archaeon]
MVKISNKTKTAAIALVLLLMASVTLMAMPVQAQYTNLQEGGSIPLPPGVTPDFTVDTHAFLSFRPNPVGVDQEILVNMWLEPPIHVSRYHSNYTVIITDPEGNEVVVTLKSYRGDSTAWFPYIVDKIGTWTIEFVFPGSYFPAGNYTVPPGIAVYLPRVISFPESCYYKPASTAEQTLTVQQEPVLSWPPSPLPTDYWTRPVAFANREWAPITGNYPWRGPGVGSDWPADTNRYWNDRENFIPYVQAPNTAHIAWKRQEAISGIVGGEARRGENVPMFQMSTAAGVPNIIYAGRCYETVTKVLPDGTTGRVWQCYDLRTGEIYWEKTDVTQIPSYIEYDEGLGEVPGAVGRAFGEIGYVSLIYIGGGRLLKYNPFTGALGLNVSIPALTSSALYYRNAYALSVQDLGADAGADRYRLINWTTAGQPAGFGAIGRAPAIISNTTYARSSLPTLYDFGSGYGARYADISPPAMGATYGTIVYGYNLTTGEELWNTTLDTEGMYSGSCAVADHGKVAILFKGGYFKCWDLATGHLEWTSELMDYPWGEASFGAYAVQSAYGLFYRQAYDGVYAFNWTNGKIVWKYKAPTPVEFETPYIDENGKGVYSFDGAAFIADGKMYTINNEHTPTPPITRGWGVHCINATTGKGIWNISGIWVWAGPGPIADGYLTVGSSDGYMYVFGKGKSATTVSASPKVSVHNSSVLIEGTVLDMSPAQPGTPCVSKESMTEWMEYLHMQKSIPAEVTGVPVSLDTFDPNGIFVHIGDVTTDMSGTFGCMWTPEVPGEYTVMATFMGDDSYGSSWAETHVGVEEAPEAPPEPEPQEEPAYLTIDLAIIAAVAVAIIIGIVNLWALRKRT